MNIRAIPRLMRIHNCLLAGIGVIIGAIITLGEFPPLETAFAFVAVALITGAGNALNDYADREIDSVDNPERPIPAGDIEPSTALHISQILFVAGIISAIFTGEYSCLLLAGLNSAMLAYYASELKIKGLVGNLVISYLVGSTFLFGGLAVGGFETTGILAAMAALSTGGRELIKDIEDVKGDRKAKSESFPLKYGKEKAAALAIVLTSAAIALTPLPYLLGIFGEYYVAAVIVSIVAFGAGMMVIGRRQEAESAGRASLFYKMGMGLGLIAFLLGAIPLESLF